MSGARWLLAAVLVQGVEAPLERHAFTHPAMGTEFRIVLYAPDSTAARDGAARAFRAVDVLERVLSDYDPESELSRLSEYPPGTWIPVSEDLWRVLQLGQRWASRTDGAFDLTVGPLTRLWRRWARRATPVPPDAIETVMPAVGHEGLELDRSTRSVRFTRPGMRLDAGGVGKGFAADRALHELEAHGITRALVDAGGDLRMGEAPPGRDGWRIEHPSTIGDDAPSSVRDVAWATSGPEYRSVPTDEGPHSHVLDPRTGRSAPARTVTVRAPNAALADILASAASVLDDIELDRLRATLGPGILILREPHDASADEPVREGDPDGPQSLRTHR